MCITGKRGASGQAMLEYLFLIFFTIILISGFVYQFNGAVKAYFDGYFSSGGYLSCLIEKGILPGESNDEGTCDAPAFNMSNGKKREVASVDFGGNPNFSYNGRGTNANGFGSSTGRLDEGYGKGVPTGQGPAGAFKKNGAGGANKKGGGDTGNDGFSTTASAGGGDSDGGQSSHIDRIPYHGRTSTDAVAHGEVSVPATGRDLKTAREVAAEKAGRKLKANKTGGNFDLSFGNILKWVFLILILFAIIFFIGSQIVAVSNGNKKRR